MSLINCSECENEISSYARWCPHCGFTRVESASLRTSVTDLAMPFGSMIVFMVKWAFASIPALVILFVAGAFMAGLLHNLIRF